MPLWRKWHVAAVAEWRSAMCPCLVRFADGWPEEKLQERGAPSKVFPSFWANVSCLSDGERDFFVQCVEHIRYGVGMGTTPSAQRAMDRLSEGRMACHHTVGASADDTTTTICDVLLMPDGRPCIGWFLDKFEFHHYAAVIAAFEERWRVSSGALWSLKDRSINAQLNTMTFSNRQDSVFGDSEELSIERINANVLRHARGVDKSLPCDEGGIAGIHHLSLSLLKNPTEAKSESLLVSLNNYIESAKEVNEGMTSYPILCRSLGCLLASKLPEELGGVNDTRKRAIGAAIHSMTVPDESMQAYQQLVGDSLDAVEGKQLGPLPHSTFRALTAAVHKLLHGGLDDAERILKWFPIVVTLCLLAPTPKARDDAIYAALLVVPSIDGYMSAYESSVLQQHSTAEKQQQHHSDGEYSRGDVGLVDHIAMNRVLCGESCAAPRAASAAAPKPLFTSYSGVWMPGVGLDSSFYFSNLIAACDALAGLLGVPDSLQHTHNASQRAVHRLRHKLRVHAFRRFGFVNASKLWGSEFRNRALPFFNALQTSLIPSPNIAVFRFRNSELMPKPFDAVEEPLSLMRLLTPLYLHSPGASPCFWVECGTVQELEFLAVKAGDGKRIRCLFTPNSRGANISMEYDANQGVLSSLAAAAVNELKKGPETRFVDVAAYVQEGRVITRLLLPSARPGYDGAWPSINENKD
ncbi:hypothetical protein DQ04_00131180 [Trypanosoma grayi]|uniref:hypothetical protein n=1 Tax=Trypanosoma grayi TaxID=71804 RepID=UPI0004F4141A|nr:hypothetical protein DQ04_00131180 [Trypanosoma grayi]KEG15259.1 hypothetical protein DQ04_00131180 [Trypanosoma grayi]